MATIIHKNKSLDSDKVCENGLKQVKYLDMLAIHCCVFQELKIKGYLRYKMITSQNVLSEAQVKNFFIL